MGAKVKQFTGNPEIPENSINEPKIISKSILGYQLTNLAINVPN